MQKGHTVTERLALALCAVALVASAVVSTQVFERLPHTEDELAFLFQARTLAQGRLWAPAPAEVSTFEAPFILIHDSKWFGKYTPGYPLLLAGGVLAGQPWLVNPVLAALCVGLIYLLGRRAYGPGTGLLAAALAAASPFLLLQAGSFMGHVATLSWTLLFSLMYLRARSTGQRAAALAGGVAMGMLFLSRPLTAVGIALPFVLWAAADVATGVVAARRGRGQGARRSNLRPYVLMLAAFLPFVAALLAYNQATTGDPLLFAYELYWPYDRIGFGEGIGIDGLHTWALGGLNTALNVEALGQYLFGWPKGWSLAPALLGVLGAAVGLALWARRAGRLGAEAAAELVKPLQMDVLLALIAASLALVHMVYWNVGQMYGPRYYFEALGALALLSARGILWPARVLGGVLQRATGVDSGRGRAVALALMLVLMVVAGLFAQAYRTWAPETFASYRGWYGIDGRGLAAVRQAGIHDALVLVRSPIWTDYAAFFSQNRPTLDGDIVYAADRGGAVNARLLLLYPGRVVYFWDGERLTPYQGDREG